MEKLTVETIKTEAKYIKPLGSYTQIVNFDLPDKATAGQVVVFHLVGRLTASLPSGYPLYFQALRYDDGPEDSIAITVNGQDKTISRGGGVIGYVSGLPVGEDIYFGVWFTPKAAGKYQFTALLGGATLDKQNRQEDSSLTKTCEAVGAGAGGAGAQDWTKQLSDMMNYMVPLMMSMMMMMMIMSMMSGMMRSFREGGT